MSEDLPDMVPVESSNLAAVGFRPAEGDRVAELFVDFGGQFIYAYRGPGIQEHYVDLMAAESKGRYFTAHIKGNAEFPFRKIQRPVADG